MHGEELAWFRTGVNIAPPVVHGHQRHAVPGQPSGCFRIETWLGGGVTLRFRFPQLAPARVHEDRITRTHLDALAGGRSFEIARGYRRSGVEARGPL